MHWRSIGYRGTTSIAAGHRRTAAHQGTIPLRALTGAPGAAYAGKSLRCATRGLYSVGSPILPCTVRQVSAMRESAYLLPVIVFHAHYTTFFSNVKPGECAFDVSGSGREKGGGRSQDFRIVYTFTRTHGVFYSEYNL